ncbi:MAG: polysaccharide deacetylase family protein [Flavobacteriales bacterium]|nr:MAG: polysaccharide deacetylase family protein [Flavobacteriales bacterium]
MKKWNIASGLAILLAGSLYIGWAWWSWPLWPLVLFVALWLGFTAYASLTLPARIYVDAVCSGPKGTMALTFDDGPHPQITPALLDHLKAENIKASFFCIGKYVEAFPALAKRIVDEGHAIGIHSQHHHWTWGFIGEDHAEKEIRTCAEAIQRTTGQRTSLFRPPFGVTNPNIAAAVKTTGVTTIGWDLRTFDTARSPAEVMKRISTRPKPGTIAVLHDTQPGTLELVKGIIAHCRQHGIELVRCDAHLRPNA